MADTDPHEAMERRTAARHLVRRPMICAEQQPDVYRLIRRHEAEIDRWFTQRLGYRVHVDGDTARLFKTGTIPVRRPLHTDSGRAFTAAEHTLLALVLAATVSGPSVISLRDLVGEVRSAATEAGVALAGDAAERRALVTSLRWLVDNGLAVELHEHVDGYAADETADAVLKMRPDRIALLMVPAVAGSETADDVLQRAERRSASRAWMRARLVEDAVLLREDVTDDEWGELRRRLGEEGRLLDEMFGLVIEARAEGVAAIDPEGTLTGIRFPTGGTEAHATLLVIERLVADDLREVSFEALVTIAGDLLAVHGRRWKADYRDRPSVLVRAVVKLMLDLRLLAVTDHPDRYRLLPVAARFVAEAAGSAGAAGEPEPEMTLW